MEVAQGKQDRHVWAQLVMQLKPGKDGELPHLFERLRGAEMPRSGPLRTTASRDDKDPKRIYDFVLFQGEEKARAWSMTRSTSRPRTGEGADGGHVGRAARVRGPHPDRGLGLLTLPRG
jgi:hypothetical protein